MKVLHFKIEEIDEEGNKINYTEGESNKNVGKDRRGGDADDRVIIQFEMVNPLQ